MRKLAIIVLFLLITSSAFAWGLIGFVGVGGEAPISDYAVDFTSNNTVITVTNSANIELTDETAFSYEAITRTDTDGENSAGRIFEKGGTMYLRTISESGGNVALDVIIVHTGTNLIATTGVNVATGAEYHVVVTYNEDGDKKAKIYVDGVLKSLSVDTAGTGTVTGDAGVSLYIGGESGGTANYDGYIRDFRQYNGKALTAAEVTSRYANNTVSGKTSHWNFYEGSGTDIADIVNSDDGTLTNGSWITP